MSEQSNSGKKNISFFRAFLIVFPIVVVINFFYENHRSNSAKSVEQPISTRHVAEAVINDNVANTLPYIGMPESSLSSTLLGRPTSVTESKDFYSMRPSHRYRYYTWEKDGEVFFKATVKYWDWANSKEIAGVVCDIWEDANYAKKNNHSNLDSAPYVGMIATESQISRWSWRGTDNTTCGEKTTKYCYDVGNASYIIWLDQHNTVLKVSTTIRGK